MWLTLSAAFVASASAAELDTTCRWTDLTWGHDQVELGRPGGSTPFARLRVGAVVDGRLGTLDDALRLRLSTQGGVQVTGDLLVDLDMFRLSEGPLDLGQGAQLVTGSALLPVAVKGDGIQVRPVVPTTYVWTVPLEGTAACRQLDLLPTSPGLHGTEAVEEAGHEPGDPMWARGGLEFQDDAGKVIARRVDAPFPLKAWVQGRSEGRAEVVVEVNGVVWASWIDAAVLGAPMSGSGLGGGGTGMGLAPADVPMKTVRDARCPAPRPLWFVGSEGAIEVGTVTPEQVLRHEEPTVARATVELLGAPLEPIGGHFEVELEGCSVEEKQVPK